MPALCCRYIFERGRLSQLLTLSRWYICNSDQCCVGLYMSALRSWLVLFKRLAKLHAVFKRNLCVVASLTIVSAMPWWPLLPGQHLILVSPKLRPRSLLP